MFFCSHSTAVCSANIGPVVIFTPNKLFGIIDLKKVTYLIMSCLKWSTSKYLVFSFQKAKGPPRGKRRGRGISKIPKFCTRARGLYYTAPNV